MNGPLTLGSLHVTNVFALDIAVTMILDLRP